MEFKLDNTDILVHVIYKNNKNMYLRIKEDGVYITAPKNINKKLIFSFLEENKDKIINTMNNFVKKDIEYQGKLLYLGKSYDICYINDKRVVFGDKKVFIGKNVSLEKYLKKQAYEVFKERLDYCYNLFKENIPYPELKIRVMKSKWGVCFMNKKRITLNTLLIHYDIKYIDYVIIHELSHFIEANHSSKFWNIVSCYEPNYKKYRKDMKNFQFKIF